MSRSFAEDEFGGGIRLELVILLVLHVLATCVAFEYSETDPAGILVVLLELRDREHAFHDLAPNYCIFAESR